MTGRRSSDRIKARIRELWPTGMSVARIGEALGISKNAVVGHAHRMDLPRRPSPIIRKAGPEQTASAAPATPPAAPPASKVERLDRGVTLGAVIPIERVRAAQAESPPVAPKAAKTRASPCCWPLGDPKQPDFRFCQAPSAPGRVYCPAHVAIAYIRPESLDKAVQAHDDALALPGERSRAA
ncbi:GcrA family cell cycle regulator [Acidocella sp.]|uniref:GcrA family cell cycle regulator n=1 Tax=Acidocella sp. TaxID=50710 RepID=UPI002630D4FA|nr:GcrA family cell cycle regulator [Acidocella sp.]